MKFINFTQHMLTPEQLKAAKEMGATEIITISNPSRFNDDGMNFVKVGNEIAQELAKLIGDEEKAFVHFPISSPRVMAHFWSKYSYLKTKKEYVDSDWEIVITRAEFVFSHTEREVIEEHQPDGSVIKKMVFRFKGFVRI